ncbi:hypothetical protein Scep_019515 [Stephania cephalantha]|uniref:Uncharacterized protein n=1 Tax=Stephania cephalantha TaxID=152367 RepID=A0AAP0IAT6_9MAGN
MLHLTYVGDVYSLIFYVLCLTQLQLFVKFMILSILLYFMWYICYVENWTSFLDFEDKV